MVPTTEPDTGRSRVQSQHRFGGWSNLGSARDNSVAWEQDLDLLHSEAGFLGWLAGLQSQFSPIRSFQDTRRSGPGEYDMVKIAFQTQAMPIRYRTTPYTFANRLIT